MKRWLIRSLGGEEVEAEAETVEEAILTEHLQRFPDADPQRMQIAMSSREDGHYMTFECLGAETREREQTGLRAGQLDASKPS